MSTGNGVDPSKHRELTTKQAKFAALVADGATLSDAYRESYDVGDSASANSVNVAASRLAKKAHVKARIERLQEGDLVAELANERLTRQWVRDKLKAEATNTKNSGSVRVRALELLGKEIKMFTEDPQDGVNSRTPEEIEQEIQKRLASVLDMN